MSGSVRRPLPRVREQMFGTESSLVPGRVELRALRLVLSELVCGTGATLRMNAGLMMFNTIGAADGPSVTVGVHAPARGADGLDALRRDARRPGRDRRQDHDAQLQGLVSA